MTLACLLVSQACECDYSRKLRVGLYSHTKNHGKAASSADSDLARGDWSRSEDIAACVHAALPALASSPALYCEACRIVLSSVDTTLGRKRCSRPPSCASVSSCRKCHKPAHTWIGPSHVYGVSQVPSTGVRGPSLRPRQRQGRPGEDWLAVSPRSEA